MIFNNIINLHISYFCIINTAFINKDGKTVVIVMNNENTGIPYFLWIDGKAAEMNALPHSIATLIF